MGDWNPAQYLTFADERTRPARDLLAHVSLASARRIFDLGSGPGNSTAVLVHRFPQAHVTGVDNSPAMLEAARAQCKGADFVFGDLSIWLPPEPPDLLFSNATFQWVPDHLGVIERLAGTLAPGGVLAVQMPDNLGEPSHRLMRQAAEHGPWAGRLRDAAAARDVLPAVATYYARLKPHFARLEIWHTIYIHPLDGPEGIIDWLGSTGLRPFLAPLDVHERAEFLASYAALLARAYPAQPDGKVLLRFPRLFMVAKK